MRNIVNSFRLVWMGLVVLSLISLGGCVVDRDHRDHDFHDDHHDFHDDHHDFHEDHHGDYH